MSFEEKTTGIYALGYQDAVHGAPVQLVDIRQGGNARKRRVHARVADNSGSSILYHAARTPDLATAAEHRNLHLICVHASSQGSIDCIYIRRLPGIDVMPSAEMADSGLLAMAGSDEARGTADAYECKLDPIARAATDGESQRQNRQVRNSSSSLDVIVAQSPLPVSLPSMSQSNNVVPRSALAVVSTLAPLYFMLQLKRESAFPSFLRLGVEEKGSFIELVCSSLSSAG
jgi:hypothetical protein